tara:strand:+ start:267 stop:710 length:444 start_codon:yes stop_codon:yes gene_type:complete
MELIIQESGGTLSFTFHCLLILFFGFVLFNIYFNPKFIEDSGFKSPEVNLLFKGPIGSIVLTFFIVSTLLLFDVAGDTTESNVVQYYFWFFTLAVFFVLAFANNLLRFLGIFSLYGMERKIQTLIFPGVALILIILKMITYINPIAI